jgi:hypothetical protein
MLRAPTAVTSPAQAVSIGSYRIPTNTAGADGCEPKEALDAVSVAGALIFGWDYEQLPQAELQKSLPCSHPASS